MEVSAIDHALEGELDAAASPQHLIPDIGRRLPSSIHTRFSMSASAHAKVHTGVMASGEASRNCVALGRWPPVASGCAQLEGLAEISDDLLHLATSMRAERGWRAATRRPGNGA